MNTNDDYHRHTPDDVRFAATLAALAALADGAPVLHGRRRRPARAAAPVRRRTAGQPSAKVLAKRRRAAELAKRSRKANR